MSVDPTLISKTACDILDLLSKGDISPLDLLDTLEQRITDVDRKVNALPTLCFPRAIKHAKALLKQPRDKRGLLQGIPLPIKDLEDVAGVRTTYGSTIYQDHVPTESGSLVKQLENSGAIVCAKSNTPEFGSGGHTFNEVFPTTLNPRNLAMSAGGSSGGAAAALASGTAWLAPGSDMAGSLRTPASFCGIVGMRPSPGRVVSGPGSAMPFDVLATDGPMARNVEDTALLLDAMCGRNANNPIAQSTPMQSFRTAAQHAQKPLRVAFSADLSITPIDPEVSSVFNNAMHVIERDGIELVDHCPDFSFAHNAFGVLRAHNYAVGMETTLQDHRDKLKPDNIWNIEKGLALTRSQIAEAERQRAQLFNQISQFMQEVDVFICPTAIVPSFPSGERCVSSCAGVDFEHYYDWLAIVYAVTVTSLPAISIPCGYANNGVPVGLQLIGKVQGDAKLLSVASYLETLFAFDALPIDPKF